MQLDLNNNIFKIKEVLEDLKYLVDKRDDHIIEQLDYLLWKFESDINYLSKVSFYPQICKILQNQLISQIAKSFKNKSIDYRSALQLNFTEINLLQVDLLLDLFPLICDFIERINIEEMPIFEILNAEVIVKIRFNEFTTNTISNEFHTILTRKLYCKKCLVLSGPAINEYEKIIRFDFSHNISTYYCVEFPVKGNSKILLSNTLFNFNQLDLNIIDQNSSRCIEISSQMNFIDHGKIKLCKIKNTIESVSHKVVLMVPMLKIPLVIVLPKIGKLIHRNDILSNEKNINFNQKLPNQNEFQNIENRDYFIDIFSYLN